MGKLYVAEPQTPSKSYISPEVIANGQPAAIPPAYGRFGIDAVIALHIVGLGYVIMRTHEESDGPIAGVSIYTEGEVSNFED